MALLKFNLKRPKVRPRADEAEYRAYQRADYAYSKAWKAKRINTPAEGDTIEIQKSVEWADLRILVYKTQRTLEINSEDPWRIRIGMNGRALLTEKELMELGQAFAEAKEILQNSQNQA